MAFIIIRGTEILSPSEFQVSYNDISKAERNANGYMIIERISTKRKLFFTYSYIPADEAAFILQLIEPTFYDVSYLDPQDGVMKTGNFYCGDRQLGMIDYRNGVARYKDFTFNLIER